MNYYIEEHKSQADVFYDVHLKWARKMCWWTGHDNNTYSLLRREKFDLAVFETFVLCHHMVAYKLNIPYVTASSFHSVVVARSHPLMTEFTHKIAGERNTFLNRLKLFVHMYLADYAVRFWLKNDELGNVDNQPYPPLDELVLKAELYLNNQNGVISYPTMSMPNVIKVGGLIAQPPQPLRGELSELMNCSRAQSHGVIVVSFGSVFATVPNRLLIPMMRAFSKVDQLVVWRLKFRPGQDTIVKVPSNVKMFDWLPQNDVLGHENTKLFVTHGGAVGMAEGVYNGIPMLGMGMQGDQPLNTQRMEQKGYGINVDPTTLTARSFRADIKRLFDNYATYRRVTNKASAIMKHLPNARKEAAFWIDHVMRFGSEHLRTVASDMPQYQLLMLDIFAFFTFMFCIFVALMLFVIRSFVKNILPRLFYQTQRLAVADSVRLDALSVNALYMKSE
ncbi:UDP-glucuronosyltransferase 2A1-like [Tubulanus polymorphus]|uniref:UDP-glucuronosyltransferase 2A1-like n=1 Tax=Tubulanus polymorphus TaxID=672921 RepID=UPI003DA52D3F